MKTSRINSAGEDSAPIGPGEMRQQFPASGDPRPLTSRQSLFWLDEQLFPNARHHNLVLTIDLSGPLDVPRLRAAWRQTVLDFDALQTVVDAAGPQQFVVSDVPDLPIVSLGSPEELPAWSPMHSLANT